MINELLSNSQNNSLLIAQTKQTTERINNSLKGLSKQDVDALLQDEDIDFGLNDTERNLDGSLKEIAYKELTKHLLLANFNKSKKQAFKKKGLIVSKPQHLSNNVAACFNDNDGTISLNGLYYGYESARKIQCLYNSKVQKGWTFELSSDFNPHIAIFIHELVHAIDYQLEISQSKTVIEEFNSFMTEMHDSKEASYAYSNICEYVAQNVSEAITAKEL